MRILAGIALLLAATGCPTTAAQQCPTNSTPIGQYNLVLTRPAPPPPNECAVIQYVDGGAADASLVADSGPTQTATFCAGPEADGGILLTLLVPNQVPHTSDLLDGGQFDFRSQTDPTQSTICGGQAGGCSIAIAESFHGQFLLPGNAPFALEADGAVPLVTNIDGGIVDDVTPSGTCGGCNAPCVLEYNIAGTRL